MTKTNAYLPILVILSYVVMIVVNTLAVTLPINGIPTGAISDLYPNLFAPAGITFSIWGLIYLLLAASIIYQLFLIKRTKDKTPLLHQLQRYFIASSVINATWIFAWHHLLMGVTVLLMLALLYTLIKIADLTKHSAWTLTDKLFLKVPFGVYFGWITVATIANITTFLVSIGWGGFGLSNSIWMIIVLLVGVIITITRTRHDRNLAYGLVPVWAYWGIWFKHTSTQGFNGNYPMVITAVLVAITVLLLSNGLLIIQKKFL
jgi:hypothetical protein